MIRLFAGLELPEAVRAELAAMTAGVPGARWVAPDNMHVTLRFVGDVDEGVGRDVHEALATVRAPRFALALAGIGTFGSKRHPHALWVGVERAPELVHLRDKIESALVRAGLEPETRKFSPHVTLARIKEPPGPRLGEFVARHDGYRSESFVCERFTLFSSHLGRSGASYTAEAHYPLD